MGKLRQVVVLSAQGKTVAEGARTNGMTKAKWRVEGGRTPLPAARNGPLVRQEEECEMTCFIG